MPRTRPHFILLLAAGLILTVLALLESGARQGLLDDFSTRESLGVYPTPMGQYFEIKWYGLEKYVELNGGVDIILIGSSVVNTGIDPEIVAKSYFDLTGKRLRIYNFGVEGLDIVPNSVYANILVQKYHPALLLFGTIPRDYLSSDNFEVNQQFLLSPWIEFMSGDWNLAGFLIDHSVALRRYLPYRNWMRSNFLETLYRIDRRENRTSSNGYEPENYVGTNLDLPPDPNSADEQDAFAKYHDYAIDLTRLSDLVSILSLGQEGITRVLVMEMPLQSTFYDYLGGISVYQDYRQQIASIVIGNGSMFIQSDGNLQIPANGRPDRAHLNKIGAPVFSTYLGTQLASLTKNNGWQFIHSIQGNH
jgi:hypothetical protein